MRRITFTIIRKGEDSGFSTIVPLDGVRTALASYAKGRAEWSKEYRTPLTREVIKDMDEQNARGLIEHYDAACAQFGLNDAPHDSKKIELLLEFTRALVHLGTKLLKEEVRVNVLTEPVTDVIMEIQPAQKGEEHRFAIYAKGSRRKFELPQLPRINVWDVSKMTKH